MGGRPSQRTVPFFFFLFFFRISTAARNQNVKQRYRKYLIGWFCNGMRILITYTNSPSAVGARTAVLGQVLTTIRDEGPDKIKSTARREAMNWRDKRNVQSCSILPTELYEVAPI